MSHSRIRPLFLALLLAACGACAQTAPDATETSVKPGINESFLDPGLDVDTYVKRFEVESREIYSQRQAIAAAVGLTEGMEVADLGAGTGLFVPMFSRSVGSDGAVYAVDISPAMLEHLQARKADEQWDNVTVVTCSERSAELAADSVDRVFICDTYHHFEYPRSTMRSVRDALRDGGEVVIVDFERIPGVTRDWLLEHVRCGKQTVIAEMESFGFQLLGEVDIDGLEENYLLRFRKS